ncbi:MAG TPA: hypothetical protein VKA67_10515 [Verrucomicrobiae bacterium]|nr:hypothetical protein [Verrucomicrobiae bacterium]
MLPFTLLSLFQIGYSYRAVAADSGYFVFLQNGWRIESSARVPANGAAISGTTFDASMWQPARVPGTVLGALVHDVAFTETSSSARISPRFQPRHSRIPGGIVLHLM